MAFCAPYEENWVDGYSQEGYLLYIAVANMCALKRNEDGSVIPSKIFWWDQDYAPGVKAAYQKVPHGD